MNTLTLNARLTSAVIAVATTLGLFGSVVTIAEPQRSVLMAKNPRINKLPGAPVEITMASNSATKEGK